MGFFDKIKRGLTRTKESLIRNIESVVIGYAEIDDDFLEDLEMVLLSGDIGVRTTDYLMRQIRRGVTEGTIHNTNEVMPFMEKTVKELLKDDTIDQENTYSGVIKEKETIDSVLDLLQNTLPIHYHVKGSKVFITK